MTYPGVMQEMTFAFITIVASAAVSHAPSQISNLCLPLPIWAVIPPFYRHWKGQQCSVLIIGQEFTCFVYCHIGRLE